MVVPHDLAHQAVENAIHIRGLTLDHPQTERAEAKGIELLCEVFSSLSVI